MLLRLRHDDVAEVVEGAHEPDAANDEALVATRHPAAARIGGVVVDRVDDVVDAQPVTQEFGRIEIEPELPGEPAEIVDVGNTWNLSQRRLDRPSAGYSDSSIRFLRVGFERVAIDLQLRRGHASSPGDAPDGQRNVGNTFP